MHRFRYLLSLLALAACQTTPVVEEPLEVDLSAWGTETIELPPGFAPDMPPGEERLLFAPGMFVEGAEDYWSYVFVANCQGDWQDADSLTNWFELYYDGLIGGVGGEEMGSDPATVHLWQVSDGVFEARIEMIDAFVTKEPLTVNFAVRTAPAVGSSTNISVLASPHVREHPIWASLESAVAFLQPQKP